MTDRTLFLGMAAVLALAGIAANWHALWGEIGAVARSLRQGDPRSGVPVVVAAAVNKPVPIQSELFGAATPAAASGRSGRRARAPFSG
jgi:phytoene dehydrogenase-like protein